MPNMPVKPSSLPASPRAGRACPAPTFGGRWHRLGWVLSPYRELVEVHERGNLPHLVIPSPSAPLRVNSARNLGRHAYYQDLALASLPLSSTYGSPRNRGFNAPLKLFSEISSFLPDYVIVLACVEVDSIYISVSASPNHGYA